MKRRKFGLLAGSGLAAASVAASAKQAFAQSTDAKTFKRGDPSLLTTTLTPFGSERAGNADGSIPPWTGGYVTAPLPPDQPADVTFMPDEQPLFTVDASNLAQYADMLPEGNQLLISKFGNSIKVYKTYRTHAVPQYVAENIAKNVTRAQFAPAGGRFGFTGAYGGIPFPIIDTSDPYAAGAQLIWNYLCAWPGYADRSTFTPGIVHVNGRVVISGGFNEHFAYPYYDPNGSPETYGGYFQYNHAVFLLPASAHGQEALVWHSSNYLQHPDITWTVVAGQGRVRKAPDEAYDTPDPSSNGLNNYDDSEGFQGDPHKYDWKLIGKKEMLVNYNNNAIHYATIDQMGAGPAPSPDVIRYEKHRVWVVEATLHPGERNTTARRVLYLDEDTSLILWADTYDAENNLTKFFASYVRVVPSLPGTVEAGFSGWVADSGDYSFTGTFQYPPYQAAEYFGPQNMELFNPEQMAASASF
jgi:hypothetical protein